MFRDLIFLFPCPFTILKCCSPLGLLCIRGGCLFLAWRNARGHLSKSDRAWYVIGPLSITLKVFPYTFVRSGVRVREDIYPEPSAVRLDGQFLSSPPLSPQCCRQVPIHCWVNSERVFSQGIELDSNRRLSAWEACALTALPPRPYP